MNWEPARADHSIDRAVATITLLNAIDPNTFDDLVVAGRKAAAAHHLTDRVDLQEPIEIPAGAGGLIIDVASGKALPRRVVFRRLESGGGPVEELSIGVQRIMVVTLRYRRWKDFNRLITAAIQALDQASPVSQAIKAVRLEYVDRFQSVPGGADHFEVIARDSDFLTPVVKIKSDALHVHSGWFDFETSNIRKLTNINIDVNDISIPPSPDPRRKIAVVSMGQYEALEGPLDQPIERLGSLHDYLKNTFRRTITQEVADRVGLNK